MIAVDTNVLVYAHRAELPLHEAARSRLVAFAESPARWAIPVSCLGEFIRVTYHLRRGYDRLAGELSGVGASIELIDN